MYCECSIILLPISVIRDFKKIN